MCKSKFHLLQPTGLSVSLTFYTTVFAQYQELLGKTGHPCHDKYLKLKVKKTLCYNGHNKTFKSKTYILRTWFGQPINARQCGNSKKK